MLPINDTIVIDRVKYKVEDTEIGYLITSPTTQFIIYRIGNKWKTADDVPLHLVVKLGKKIEDLIWFNSMGI